MGGRRGQADEPGVREAMRQVAPQYYAAKTAGKDLTEVDKTLDDARTKLYARDYSGAMRGVRDAQRMLAEMK